MKTGLVKGLICQLWAFVSVFMRWKNLGGYFSAFVEDRILWKEMILRRGGGDREELVTG